VDPVEARLEMFQRHLASRFQVTVAKSMTDGIAKFESMRPSAVVASLRQDSGHGLQFCRLLRELTDDDACVMVVFGQPKGGGGRSREALEALWKVDAFFPFLVKPEVLEPLLWHELTRKRSGQGNSRSRGGASLPKLRGGSQIAEAEVERSASSDRLATTREGSKTPAGSGAASVGRTADASSRATGSAGQSRGGRPHGGRSETDRRREAQLNRLKSVLQTEFHLLDPPIMGPDTKPEELSWFELLSTATSQDVILALLKKELRLRPSVGSPADASKTAAAANPGSSTQPTTQAASTPTASTPTASTQSQPTSDEATNVEPSWKELLSTDVSAGSLRQLLKKEVRLFEGLGTRKPE